MVKTRSSRGHLNSVISRLSRIRTFSEFRAYRMTDELIQMLAAMGAADRDVALSRIGETHALLNRAAPIRRLGTVRVKAWDGPMIAKLQAAEAKFGNDEGIARHLGLPIKAVRTARWKYCGPRKPRTPRPTVGVAATPA